jgi:hypothetical protein
LKDAYGVFPRGFGHPPAQMPLMQESRTKRMRWRLTGARGIRTSFGKRSSWKVSSFQRMRAGPASGSKANSRRTWLGGTVSVGDVKLRRAAAKLPLELHEYARSPKAELGMFSTSPDESRRSVAVSVCSTWARFPARVALYYY